MLLGLVTYYLVTCLIGLSCWLECCCSGNGFVAVGFLMVFALCIVCCAWVCFVFCLALLSSMFNSN